MTRGRSIDPALGVSLSMLPGDPRPGETWASRHSGERCCILRVEQRRYAWVRVRIRGGERAYKLAAFTAAFMRV